MENNIYFKDRNNNDYTKYTKEEIRDIVNPFKPETFIPILKDMNYPYFENEWGHILSKSYKSVGGTRTVIGRYISKMRLISYKNFTFEDSQYHKELQEFSLKPYGLSFDEEGRLATIFDNEDLLPIWNYKKPSEKDKIVKRRKELIYIMPARKDLTGQIFGPLTVLKLDEEKTK